MTIGKKTSIASLIFGAVALLLIFLGINPIFGQIKQASENFLNQKKELVELEAKIENLHDFKANFKLYQPNLEKIDKLFADASEPTEFIEFLESEAAISRLSIGIAPFVLKRKEGDFWATLDLNLNLEGSFPNLSRFLERLESAPYLIQMPSLNIRKVSDKKYEISAALLINVYVR